MPNVFIVRQFGEVLSHVWGVFAGGRSAARGFTQCAGVVCLVATAQSKVVDPYGHQLLRQLCDLAARTTPVVKVTRKCLLTCTSSSHLYHPFTNNTCYYSSKI